MLANLAPCGLAFDASSDAIGSDTHVRAHNCSSQGAGGYVAADVLAATALGRGVTGPVRVPLTVIAEATPIIFLNSIASAGTFTVSPPAPWRVPKCHWVAAGTRGRGDPTGPIKLGDKF